MESESESVQWLSKDVGISNSRLVEKQKDGSHKEIQADRLANFMTLERNWQLGPGYRLLRMKVQDSGLLVKRLCYPDGKIVDIPFTTAGIPRPKQRRSIKWANKNKETLFDTDQYR